MRPAKIAVSATPTKEVNRLMWIVVEETARRAKVTSLFLMTSHDGRMQVCRYPFNKEQRMKEDEQASRSHPNKSSDSHHRKEGLAMMTVGTSETGIATMENAAMTVVWMTAVPTGWQPWGWQPSGWPPWVWSRWRCPRWR